MFAGVREVWKSTAPVKERQILHKLPLARKTRDRGGCTAARFPNLPLLRGETRKEIGATGCFREKVETEEGNIWSDTRRETTMLTEFYL